MSFPEAILKQRGRASVDFLAHVFRGTMDIRNRANEAATAIEKETGSLPDDLDERLEFMESALQEGSSAFRAGNMIGEWHAKNHGIIATEAFEEIFEEIEPQLKELSEKGETTVKRSTNMPAPAYWDGVDFHRTAGGWDGHEYQGYIHGEIVHRKMVDAIFPGGIFKQRLDVAKRPPKDHYDRILDMGSSTGHFTMALAEAYPKAQIYGVDLSLQLLEHAQRVANAKGYSWKLYQRPAEDTGFDSEYFDLVGSYILLHEMPETAIRGVFKEAFRVLKPGGDMIMSDVTRYADLDKLQEWRADRGAAYGGEPHWRESARLDLGQIARDAGFVDVSAKGDKPMNYPYVVMGRKPE